MKKKSNDSNLSNDYFVRKIELKSSNQTLHLYQQTVGGVNCVVWDAAIVLVKYLDITNDRTKCLKHKKVLELGAGLGCAGLTAACFGAEVILTDLAEALPLLEKNIRANEELWKSAGGSAKAQVLDWNMYDEINFEPDIVLVTDCVYYEESSEKLLQLLEKLCQNGSTYVIMSQEERDTPLQIPIWNKFFTKLNQRMKVAAIPLQDQDPFYSSPDIYLMKISKL